MVQVKAATLLRLAGHHDEKQLLIKTYQALLNSSKTAKTWSSEVATDIPEQNSSKPAISRQKCLSCLNELNISSSLRPEAHSRSAEKNLHNPLRIELKESNKFLEGGDDCADLSSVSGLKFLAV
jgi:hypothetical protein